MLILIAESKTMLDEQTAVSPENYREHMPSLEEQASIIMEGLEKMSQSEMATATGLSSSLAAKLRRMTYEYPNKNLGIEAIRAYTGVVFKALGYDSLTPAAQSMCNKDVLILSSLYGVLRPDDIIKPYRLDFTSKVSPDGKALNTYWKTKVTIQIVKIIKQDYYGEILNLLPGDASKCIDWKTVKRFCKVWKVDFVELIEGGGEKTPNATKLKTMRGTLLRQILQDGIQKVSELKNIQNDDILFEGTPVYADHLQFLC